MIDAFSLDVVKDTKLGQVAGPALNTALTMRAEAQPDN
jgi:hypothetical protein